MASKSKVRSAVPAAVIGVAASAAAMGLIVPSLQKAAQSKPADTRAVTKSTAVKKSITVTSKSQQPVTGAPGKRRDLTFYTGDLRANMFSEPVAPAPKDVTPPISKPVPPAPVDPLAEWSFTGSAKVNDVTYGIVENTSTHDSVMLKAGDDFEGFKVDSIDTQFVMLTLGKEAKSMMVSMNYSYVPLSKSAAFLSASPGAAQGMDPNMAKMAAMAAGMGATGQSITLPNGTQLDGARAQRYMNRLNQGWPGAQGAQGATGGGGGFGGGMGRGGGGGGGRRGGFGGFGGNGGG